MRPRSLAVAVLQMCLLAPLSSSFASAQISPERLASLRSRVVQLKACLDRIPPRQRRMLSSGALNLMQLAQNWDKIEPVLARSSGVATHSPSRRAAPRPFGTAIFPATPVSNPETDFLYSILAGFTQSETSTAWCG